ncbi:hypothetical protein D3C77_770410 [compost metagenome]
MENTPRLMIRKWLVGYSWPMKALAPSMADTGWVRPENWIAGSRVAMVVPKMAAIWLLRIDDINRPRPVAQAM